MRFFFDRNFSLRIARMVEVFELAHTVRHHDQDARFDYKTTDVEWLQALGSEPEPWTIISGDGRILKNKVERQALDDTGFQFFCLSRQWMNMKLHEQAWKFVKLWPDVVEAATNVRHRIFEISGGKSLKVEPM
ncbi:MAG: hypothetical protein KY476_19300 [Planctomycetes bacterium]|nr:hypothetical protein [Planctomycetota bacterium]